MEAPGVILLWGPQLFHGAPTRNHGFGRILLFMWSFEPVAMILG